MELPTPRLILREFTPDDFEDVHAYATHPEAIRYVTWGPNTPEQTREVIGRRLASQRESPRRSYDLAAQCRSTGRVIGSIGLTVTRAEHREGEVGYVFHPDHWNRGYATEASVALVAFGFGALNLHRIFATGDPANKASARVLEKSGLRYEGRLRDHLLQRGAWRDSLLYAILEQDRPADPR